MFYSRKKVSIFKKRLYLIIKSHVRTRYNLHNSKNYINFAHYFGDKLLNTFSKILIIVYFAKPT